MGYGSNNTNKLSPQELSPIFITIFRCSNNTNKLSPQEPQLTKYLRKSVQIIQINLVLKNAILVLGVPKWVQIIQINLVLKNTATSCRWCLSVQIIQINLVLKNCRPYYSIFMLYLQYILSISIIKSQIKSCVFIFKLFH